MVLLEPQDLWGGVQPAPYEIHLRGDPVWGPTPMTVAAVPGVDFEASPKSFGFQDYLLFWWHICRAPYFGGGSMSLGQTATRGSEPRILVLEGWARVGHPGPFDHPLGA